MRRSPEESRPKGYERRKGGDGDGEGEVMVMMRRVMASGNSGWLGLGGLMERRLPLWHSTALRPPTDAAMRGLDMNRT